MKKRWSILFEAFKLLFSPNKQYCLIIAKKTGPLNYDCSYICKIDAELMQEYTEVIINENMILSEAKSLLK